MANQNDRYNRKAELFCNDQLYGDYKYLRITNKHIFSKQQMFERKLIVSLKNV